MSRDLRRAAWFLWMIPLLAAESMRFTAERAIALASSVPCGAASACLVRLFISERTDLREKLEARLDALHKVHSRISEQVAPIVNDSYFELVTTAEDVGQTGDIIVRTLVQGGMQAMQAIVEVGAETNLVAGLLTARALGTSPAIVTVLDDRIAAAVRRAKRQLDKLPA